MKEMTSDDPETRSPDGVAENIQRLKALFPELVIEGPNGPAVNVDVLKQLVGDATVTDADEKYGLNWHGKRRARQLALTSSTGTLRPCPEDSVDWDSTQNLMIEGDNLEVLKLLQKSYAGKVKLVYIDPPYNTGKDFVYPDDFQDGIKNYLQLTGQVEGGTIISSNTEASGRFHTDWLNMMLPRLRAARDLLTPDGVLLISIDDGESARLRQVCDEIFGEENFVAQLVWTQGRKSIAAQVAVNHEYCLAYCRDRTSAIEVARANGRNDWSIRKEGLEEIYAAFDKGRQLHGGNHDAVAEHMASFFGALLETDPAKAHSHYNKVDATGLYFAGDISQGTGAGGRFDVVHPRTGQPCKVPSGGWRFGADKLPTLLAEGRIHFGADHTSVPCLKRYLRETEFEVAPSVFYRDGRGASRRLADLMGASVFQYPKDEEVIARFVNFVVSKDDENALVVDFFAGSGTTGHAVMSQNAADGGTRRYILVQLPEPLDPENKDQRVAAEFCVGLGKPRNIAELTKERLRRAAKKIKEDHPMFAGDLGFRVFKLDYSNILAWEPDRNSLGQTLYESVEHIKPERTESDVLYELLLKRGLDLCIPIETRTIGGKQVHSVGGGVLMACLAARTERGEVEALAQGIVDWRRALAPAGDTTCVFRDSAFADDVAKTNMAVILEQHGIANVRSL